MSISVHTIMDTFPLAEETVVYPFSNSSLKKHNQKWDQDC